MVSFDGNVQDPKVKGRTFSAFLDLSPSLSFFPFDAVSSLSLLVQGSLLVSVEPFRFVALFPTLDLNFPPYFLICAWEFPLMSYNYN